MSDRLAAAVIAAWTITCGWLALVAHLSLRTNAFDLSMFDYALWSTLHGRAGYVPFVGHSIFSEHFMPVLYVLAPVYAVAQSPVTLIVVQIAAAAAAAWLLHRIAVSQRTDLLVSLAVVLAFLLSRRSQEAITSFFYPESLQPVLIFAMVLAWIRGRAAGVYWIAVVLLLATKEDAAVYVAAFALLEIARPQSRRTGAVTLAIAVAWLAVAVGVMIPRSRALDGLAGASHFLNARYGDVGGIAPGVLATRILSYATLARVFNLVAAFGFASLAAPVWVAIAVPGLLIDRAATPTALQAALSGHYAFPLLPWMAVAAVFGLNRIARRGPAVANAWAVGILVLTVVETPLLRATTRWTVAAEARSASAQIPRGIDGRIAVQPNLLPHLPHDSTVVALAPDVVVPEDTAAVALTDVGDLWPFSAGEVQEAVRRYRSDPRFVQRTSGPLYWFERKR